MGDHVVQALPRPWLIENIPGNEEISIKRRTLSISSHEITSGDFMDRI
jgi:hypothetical protein